MPDIAKKNNDFVLNEGADDRCFAKSEELDNFLEKSIKEKAIASLLYNFENEAPIDKY